MDGMRYGYGFYNATNFNGALDAYEPQGVLFLLSTIHSTLMITFR